MSKKIIALLILSTMIFLVIFIPTIFATGDVFGVDNGSTVLGRQANPGDWSVYKLDGGTGTEYVLYITKSSTDTKTLRVRFIDDPSPKAQVYIEGKGWEDTSYTDEYKNNSCIKWYNWSTGEGTELLKDATEVETGLIKFVNEYASYIAEDGEDGTELGAELAKAINDKTLSFRFEALMLMYCKTGGANYEWEYVYKLRDYFQNYEIGWSTGEGYIYMPVMEWSEHLYYDEVTKKGIPGTTEFIKEIGDAQANRNKCI